MSEPVVIRFSSISKDYLVGDAGIYGFKNIVLHFPKYLRARSRRRLFRALDDVTFEIHRGDFFAIIGKNGSGKSTALGIMAGVLRPSAGSVETFGHICPLLQLGAGFHYDLTGKENIFLNGVLLGLTRREIKSRFDEIVAFSELQDFLLQPIRMYSSGMLARLGFSVAIHLRPEILLVDEILAVGDEAFQAKCKQKMEEFRQRGATVVLVTHDQNTVQTFCDRAALLSEGKVIALGDPRMVVNTYRETVVHTV